MEKFVRNVINIFGVKCTNINIPVRFNFNESKRQVIITLNS